MIYRKKIDGHKFVVLYPPTAPRARCADVTPPPPPPPQSDALCEGARPPCLVWLLLLAASRRIAAPDRSNLVLAGCWLAVTTINTHRVVFDSPRHAPAKQCDRNHLSARVRAPESAHAHTLMRHHKYKRPAFAYISISVCTTATTTTATPATRQRAVPWHRRRWFRRANLIHIQIVKRFVISSHHHAIYMRSRA